MKNPEVERNALCLESPAQACAGLSSNTTKRGHHGEQLPGRLGPRGQTSRGNPDGLRDLPERDGRRALQGASLDRGVASASAPTCAFFAQAEGDQQDHPDPGVASAKGEGAHHVAARGCLGVVPRYAPGGTSSTSSRRPGRTTRRPRTM